MTERTDEQWQIEINRNLAVELIQEMPDADFAEWFEEHRAGMDEAATRMVGDE